MTRNWYWIAAVMLLCNAGCASMGVAPVLNPKPLYDFYVAHNWVPLAMPDSRFSPGAVFTLKESEDPRWVGTLADCSMPTSIVTPVQGSAGQLTLNVSTDYAASAVLQIKGIKAGPEFSRVHSAALALEQHGPSSLNMIQVQLWFNDPQNQGRIPQMCKDFLSRPDTYVVQEAYSVTKGKYTLKDSKNAKFSLSGLKAGPLEIGADAHVTPNADGTLTFDQTLYTAVRRLIYAGGNWESMGHTQSVDADRDVLKKLRYLK